MGTEKEYSLYNWEGPEKVFHMEDNLKCYTKILSLFGKEYSSSSKILDVGCGNGDFHVLLSILNS